MRIDFVMHLGLLYSGWIQLGREIVMAEAL